MKLLEGAFKTGDTVELDHGADGYVFRSVPATRPPEPATV